MKKDFQFKALIYRVFAVFCLFFISQTVHAQVSGTVFRDFNSNGLIDTTASFKEVGQIGVIVKAFNASGLEVGTATTDINGLYSISGVSGPLRVEFANLPNLDFSSFSGGTSVQFVNGGATNVNFGVNYPSDYCQKNPQVIVPCFALRTPLNGSSEPILVEAGLSSGGFANFNLGTTTISSPLSSIIGNDNATPPVDGKSRIYDAFWNQVGTVNGLAWHPATNTVLAASFFKANAFFPNGPSDVALGSIYAINRTTNPNTVSTIFKANAGTDTHSYLDGSRDPAGRNDAGKKGWGDIDLSEDGTILYAVNLFDKKLYAIPVIQSGGNLILNTTKSVSIIPFYLTSSPCSNNDWVPGAIKIKRGKVYVSVTCTAEISQLKTDLKAYVYSFNVGTVPNEIGITSNEVSNFNLSYKRTFEAPFQPCTSDGIHVWNPWKNDAALVECSSSPWVMDLEFDANNNLLIGIRNRAGDQFDFTGLSGGYDTGFLNLGDVIKATPNGSVWTVVSADQNTDPTDETFEDGAAPGDGSSHQERLHGGMAVHLGLSELITGATNGGQYFGWSVNDLNSGATKRTYVIGSGDENFVKAAVVGDVELLCAVAPIQIGNRIWIDKDKDGIQDADEKPYPNIKVALYDSTGTKVSEVTTNALGEYYFDTLNVAGGKLLPQSRYEIRIAKTAINDTLKLTESNTGISDLIDSDADLVGSNYVIPVLTGNYGENNHSYDFGFSPELPDLKVTKTSNKSVVKKGQNVKFTVTIKNEGKGKATSVKLEDLIPSGATLVNSTATSTTSTNAGSYNAGIWSIDSLFAKDSVILVIEITANQEGVLSNVAQIKSMNEKDVDSTPGNSNYKEDDIATACYTVPYEFCKADKPTFTLSAPDSLTTVKWFRNGVELMAEAGKKNITVSDSGSYYYQGITPTTLCNAGSCCPVILDPYKIAKAGNDSTVCASDGMLQLKTAPAGTSWSSSTGNPSPATIGSSSGLISGMVLAGNYQFIIKGDTCCADTIKITKTDCFGSIGDYVWFDKNQNGLQDVGEVPVKGIKVILYAANGTTKLDSTFTDITGKYLFDSLKTNDYYVKFVAPKDSALTGNLAGTNRAIDSNADPVTGLSDRVSINTALPVGDPGRDNRDVDAGIIPQYGSIGDYVWTDNNNDGQQSAGELPIQGMKVYLYNAAGTVKLDSTVTDAFGKYLFDSLLTGSYKIKFVAPAGTIPAKQNLGSDVSDSDANKLGFSQLININTALLATDTLRNNPQIDAGFVPVGSIGDFVFTDKNGDGIQNTGDTPIAGIKVYLLDNAGVKLDSTITDSNGKYLFDSLLANTYKVKFVIPVGSEATLKTAGGNTATDSNINPDGTTDAVIIDTTLPLGNIGRNNPTIDAGIKVIPQYGSIGDYVWTDTNNDGQQAGESPIAGVKVILYAGDGITKLDSTVTDANGKYLFDSLLTGSYKVKFVAPAGTIPAKSNIGDDKSDSDAGKNGFSQVININTALLATDTLRNNPQIDAGFVPVGSIGDYVFTDKNGDGIQNAGDTPIAGIKVYLLDNAGVKLDSTITDSNGKYLFDSLLANTYKVKFVIPVGSEATLKTAGGNTATDSNINPDGTTDAVIIDTTLPLGNIGRNNPTIDAGIKGIPQYGSIGDYVWTDQNNDGQQTVGELPIAGVKVILYAGDGITKLDSTVTDANGKYLFDSLLTGAYKVKFVAPAGTIPAKQNLGSDVSDSDAGKNGFSQVININTALLATDTLRNNPQIDAGFVPVGSIGDFVFTDKNGDGIQNTGDTPIAGIKVYLLDNAGVKLDSTITDSNGKYLFDSLLANTYKVKFVIPVGSEATLKTAGGNTATDSNINPDGTTDAVIIDTTLPLGNIGRNNPTIDAGIKGIPQYGSIGDYVWTDTNNDGQQAGELPIAGVKVILYAGDGITKLDSTVTDANGKYLFDSLLTGSYKVKFVAPAGTIPAKSNIGDDKSDSDAGKNGFSQVININTALLATDTLRNNPQIDAGFVPVGSLGDFVFLDKNANGIQEITDTPIAGIKVYLLDNAGVKLDSTITDSNGKYLFDSLLANTYKVKFVIPVGSEATLKTAGGNTATDSNINPDGTTDAVIIDTTLPLGNIGRNNPTIDAGIKVIPQYGSIGDYVWTDTNNDGQQAGESPIAGVKVILYAGDGITKLDSTVTDANGKYLFDSLLTGSYKVKFVAPAGTIPAKQNLGSDVSDSDANKLGFSQLININTALLATDTLRNNPQIDAGFVPVGSIGDFVFNDKDGNNVQSLGDTPLAGVKVYLLNSLGAKIDSTVTDASGKYLFDSLVARIYKVQFVAPTGTNIVPKGTGTATDSDANPSTGITDNVVIDTTLPLGNIGRNNPTIDAGIKGIPQYGSIGDYVWTDTNNDGQQAGELPIAGVKVILYAGDGVTKLDSTVTDANGKYLFDSLLTGAYKVKFVAPAGTIPAKQNLGSDVSDSDANKLGFSQLININTALLATDTLRNNPQIDAGFVPVGSIGDFVFLDKDNSNTQTAGDTPVAGVKVYLLDNAGAKIDSTITDVNGKYLFTNVPSGTYSVQFVAPVGSTFVTPNSGDDNLDSDAGVNGKTSPITIDATQPVGSSSRDNRSVDAGIKPTAIPYGSIGDYVWFDANKDGLQTSGEAPVKGVKVYLVNSTGTIIDSTKTDVNGKYLFDSLLTGSYKIRFVAPKDSNLTVKGTNPLSAIDSNPDATTGLTDAVLIDTSKPAGDPGRDNRDVDAGITVNLGSIAGKTFDDNDKSGTQNVGDIDRPTVKVYLYKEIAGVYVKVDSVITDSQGNYKFNNLTTANYQVQFSKPMGTTFTNSNVGNDTLDSDASLTDGKTGIISINTNLPETDLGRNSKFNDAGFIPVPVDCKTDICVPFTITRVPK